MDEGMAVNASIQRIKKESKIRVWNKECLFCRCLNSEGRNEKQKKSMDQGMAVAALTQRIKMKSNKRRVWTRYFIEG